MNPMCGQRQSVINMRHNAIVGLIALFIVQASSAIFAANVLPDPELLLMLGALSAAESVGVEVDQAIDQRILDNRYKGDELKESTRAELTWPGNVQ